MQIFYTKYTAYKGGRAGGEGVVAPHLQTRGANGIKSPHFAGSGMMPASTEKNIGII